MGSAVSAGGEHPLVECVPNFSEGRRPEVVRAIAAGARAVAGVTVLDTEHDPSHNRMVLTLVGPPDAVLDGALAASAVAVEAIDLTRHTGEHPRMGAVDVVPFVPLRDVSMETCVELARRFASRFAERFGIPVFLYEAAATRPERRDLARVREGQFEGLRERIGTDPARAPDFGPARIHPTAGATAVGARPVLIAYNVDLGTDDLALARRIARQVRERDGGLPAVKAMGFALEDRGIVQVSMNLTDFHRTPLHTAFRAVEARAAEQGVAVEDSEVVGLVPLEAVVLAAAEALRLRGFTPEQIIETRLVGAEPAAAPDPPGPLGQLPVAGFVARVAAPEPVPGGGSVAALAGSLAASLVAMVCRLTLGRTRYQAVQERIAAIEGEAAARQARLLELVDRDAAAYDGVAAALRLPRSDPDERAARQGRLADALRAASEVPLETAEEAAQVGRLAREVAEIGNRNARSDAETAALLAQAAVGSACRNVRVNLDGLGDDPAFVAAMSRRLAPLEARPPG